LNRFDHRWNGLYALRLYLPVAALARAWRTRSRIARGKESGASATRLPQRAWSDVFARRSILLTETAKRSGNVTLAELGVLAQAAANVAPGREVIEIGTFDGRTTINLALNAPQSPVFTLDLPADHPTRFALAAGEAQYVDKPAPGARFRQDGASVPDAAQRITQLFGDSATFDWLPHWGRAGLVFVDGSHAYDYVRADTATAMRLVAPGAVVLWHDYGVWDGVTNALEEIEAAQRLGLRHIRGTSLVVWRAP
jgi:predicted O-methyltransferase YrrM